jgi:hypothetical protein
MKVILYTNDEGWVSVVTPVYPPDLTTAQEDQIAAFIQQKDVPPLPDGSKRPSFIKDTTQIQDMRFFFESWRMDKVGKVSWNQQAAIDMKKGQLRVLRKPLLEKLDVEFMQSLESGDSAATAAVASKKKALRDVTTIDITPYDTPEKLNAFVPDILKQ